MATLSPDQSRAKRQLLLNIFGDLNYKNIFIAVGVLLFFNIGSSALYDLFKSFGHGFIVNAPRPFLIFIISTFFFSLLIILIMQTVNTDRAALHAVSDVTDEVRVDTLVLLLSALNDNVKSKLPSVDDFTLTDKKAIIQWLKNKEPHNPWFMNYLAIKGHRKNREKPLRVILAPSPQSEIQIELFNKIFSTLFEDKIQLYTPSKVHSSLQSNVNYESTDDIYQLLNSLLEHELAHNRLVVFDVTSGTKPASIAASIVATGDDPSCIQYVNMSNQKAKVWQTTYEKEYRH